MKDEPIDRILSSEETLFPSSGFAAAVMQRVREEAATPAPLPFPWKRAAFGSLVACGGLGWGVAKLAQLAIAVAHNPQPVVVHVPNNLLQPMQGLGWAALALAVSFASWAASRWMIGGSRL